MSKLSVDFNEILGDENGCKLFGLIVLDGDDPEQSSLEVWRANDAEHLRSLVKEANCGDDGMPEEIFDDQWNELFLAFEIGEVLI